jgi:hypothetical protein
VSYKLICMAFDGDYQTERPEFESVEDAREYSGDLGSKWYFYPYHFVVSASGKTVMAAPELLEPLVGMRVSSVAKRFAEFASTEEAQGMDVERFMFALPV